MRIRSFALSLAFACAPAPADKTPEPQVDSEDPVVEPVVDTDVVDTDTDTMDTDTPQPVPEWVLVTSMVPGLCESFGLCWDNTTGPGLRVFDVEAVGPDDIWMRSGWDSIVHYQAGAFSRLDIGEIADMDASPYGTWFIHDGYLHRIDGAEVLRFELPIPPGYDTRLAVSPLGEVAVGGSDGALGFDGVEFHPIGMTTPVEIMSWQYELWIQGTGETRFHDGAQWQPGPGMFLMGEISQPAPGEAWIPSIYTGLLHTIGGQIQSHNLPNYVDSIAATTDGIWVQANEDLLAYDGMATTPVDLGTPISELDHWGTDVFAAGGPGVLTRVRDQQALSTATQCGRIQSISGIDADNLVAGCEGSVLRKVQGVWQVDPIGEPSSAYDVVVQGDTTWAITYQALVGLTPGQPTVRIPVSRGQELVLDHEGTLWVGTFDGLLRLDGDQLVADGPAAIQTLRAGPDALYGTSGRRLWRYQNGSWSIIPVSVPWTIGRPLPTADGGVVIGGWEGVQAGIMVWDTQQWRTIAPSIAQPNHLAGDPSTTLWVVGQNGIGVHEVRGDVVVATHNDLPGIQALEMLDDGTLAVGTVEGAIGLLRP